MPSPMALPSSAAHTPSSFLFKKKSTSKGDAASSLAELYRVDSDRRSLSLASTFTGTTTSTPALSYSSSVTEGHGNTPLEGCDDVDVSDVEEDDESGLSRPRIPPNSMQSFNTRHVEFGHCADQRFRHTSQHPKGAPFKEHVEVDPPHYILMLTYISYIILILIGHMRDFFGKRLFPKSYTHLMPSNGYAALNSDFDSFYTRRLKARMDDTFSRPVTAVPGRTIVLLDRHSKNYNDSTYLTGTRSRVLNVSSYNYLGFAQARGGCADAVEEGIKRYGVSSCGARLEAGTTDLHHQAEALVARFVGQEDAVIISMGYATNSTTLPSLVSKGCLVISDEFNHASIRVGVRLSGASVRTFKHNDMKDLETLLREVISQGQPRTHRPWKKILLVVEGLYSMEGTLVNLPAIIELKRKYKVCRSIMGDEVNAN
ncbi:serine palmitoyltransferase component [Tulasnella sp. 419]|nr:serine palmitoyltransferase component [Tulasnella sp. 419]